MRSPVASPGVAPHEVKASPPAIARSRGGRTPEARSRCGGLVCEVRPRRAMWRLTSLWRDHAGAFARSPAEGDGIDYRAGGAAASRGRRSRFQFGGSSPRARLASAMRGRPVARSRGGRRRSRNSALANSLSEARPSRPMMRVTSLWRARGPIARARDGTPRNRRCRVRRRRRRSREPRPAVAVSLRRAQPGGRFPGREHVERRQGAACHRAIPRRNTPKRHSALADSCEKPGRVARCRAFPERIACPRANRAGARR